MANANEMEKEFFFKGQQLECTNQLIGRGSFLYDGSYYKKEISFDQGIGGKTIFVKKEAAIRRILKTDCLDEWENIAKLTNTQKFYSKSVVKIFTYEDGKDDWRYFALEPFSSTLYHYCTGQYERPELPSEPQVIDQMIIAKDYLHCNVKRVHGDLNPLNVIISQHPTRIKLSDFGLSKFSYTKCPSNIIPQMCKRKYWLAPRKEDNEINPELIEDSSEDIYPTEEEDKFAIGCLIFYFLKKGVHPFGDDLKSIEKNMKEKNPVNLQNMEEGHAQLYKEALENLLVKLIQQPKIKSKLWREATAKFENALSLKIFDHQRLGEGSYGKVYKGKYKGDPVAVKRIKNSSSNSNYLYEMEITEHLNLHHDNVLKLFHYEYSNDNKYWHLVLELCRGTLTDFCEKKKTFPDMPPDLIILYQISIGVHYIHSQNLVHRDIKPDNILVSMTGQMKVSDLGFVKRTKENDEYSLSAVKGTPLYMAAELLKQLDLNTLLDETVQTDTFSVSCMFFYFLTRGFHPFHKEKYANENWITIKNNIGGSNPVGLNSRKESLQPIIYNLIGEMIKKKEDRIELSEVLKMLSTELTARREFKRVENPIIRGCGDCWFHPTDLVLACGFDYKIIFLSAANPSIPFSNWKENKLQLGNIKGIGRMKWNVDGTQLASVSFDNFVKVWNYPSGEILFKEKIRLLFRPRLEWNPFRKNVLAVYDDVLGIVDFFNSFPDDQRTFKFLKHKFEGIKHMKWISENQFAVCYRNRVEIYKIDESNSGVIKQYEKPCYIYLPFYPIESLFVWDERTKCFAIFKGESVEIWSMETDETIHSLKVKCKCTSFAWRPNGKKMDVEGMDAARKSPSNFHLAVGLRNGDILIWTPLEEKKEKILSQHSDFVDFLSFSPDGRFLTSTVRWKELIIWSTETWQPVFIDRNVNYFDSSSWMSSSADNSPEYKFISFYDGDTRLYEYAVGQSATTIKGSGNVPSSNEDGDVK